MDLKTLVLKYRFILVNLLAALYFWLVQPIVLARLSDWQTRQNVDWWMFILLIGVQGAEFIGMLLKRPLSHYSNQFSGGIPAKPGFWGNLSIFLFVIVPVLHLGFSALVAIMAFDLVKPALGNWVGILQVGLVFGVIFKEAFFLVLAISQSPLPGFHAGSGTSGFNQWLERWLNPEPITQPDWMDVARDLTGDMLLVAYLGLTYTAAWEFLVQESPVHGGSGLLAEYVGVSVLFFMVYGSTRLVYLFQELPQQKIKLNRWLDLASFVVTWLLALIMLPVV